MWEAKNYINGEFVISESESVFENLDPCTETSLGTFFNSTEAEVDKAYDHARSSFESWRSISRVQRAEYLYKMAKLIEENRNWLAEIVSWETGKNFNESIAEVNEALHMAQYAFGSGRTPQGEAIASEISEKDAYMLRKPKGVVAVISPWNFPLAIGAFWCAAPALVEGNTVIIKPSEDAPYSSQAAIKLYHEAGIPAGVINLDQGASAFKLSGQRCVSSGRLIVQREIYEDFCKSFAEHVKNSISTGPPFVDGGFTVGKAWTPNQRDYMGPLINSQQLERVTSFNDQVIADAKAEVLVAPVYNKPGYFVTPLVYKTEWRDAPYLKNEVFGPHVAIIPFDTIDDAVRIYNDTDYGLAVGVVTEDFKKARICRDRCDYGMCYWNGGSIAAESHVAFGGVKKSGNGYPSAARTFRAVTHEVTWTVNHDDKLTFPQGMK